MEVWEGIDHKANTKMQGSKYKITCGAGRVTVEGDEVREENEQNMS